MQQRQQQQQLACPAAWQLYFAQEEYKHDDRRAMLIRELAAFFASEEGWQMLSAIHTSHAAEQHVLQLDFAALHSR